MKPSLFIVDAVRTPFCRAGSALADLDAVELGRTAVSALLTQTGIDPHIVDETIFGCVGQPPQAQNIARVIALRAGIPHEKPAFTVHRNCASGLEAITTAHARMCADQGDVFIVGGVESMSQMPLYFSQRAAGKLATLSRTRSFGQRIAALAAFRPSDFTPLIGIQMGLTDPVCELNMGQTAELLAREFHISREAQDTFSLRSHQRAASAPAYPHEIAPVYIGTKVITADNGIRADSSMEKLAALRPLFDRKSGTVTAGNSSQITDGAVALLVASEEKVRAMGWQPLGRLVDYAAIGCDPARMGLGPVSATEQVLARTSLKLQQMDIVELNEAFAAQVLAVLQHFPDLDPARINTRGGAIALGHPVGATGARLVQSALLQLRQTHQQRALVTLCVGGGQGVAAILETP